MVLSLSHVSYTYPHAAKPALSDLSAIFDEGWCGIVGGNGCGKTTLARIACHLIKPDEGSVSPMLSSCYCAQECAEEPAQLADFACDYAPEARRLRAALGIEDDMLWRFAGLSCGEQKKVQVAVALWQRPQVLALDEPTNHLDARCRDEVRAALAGYRGIGLLISHDRELLDSLARRCLCFEGQRAIMRPGTYTQARSQAERERATLRSEREALKATLARLKAEQADRAQLAARSAARRSGRNLEKHDSDGRARLRRAVVTSQDGKAGKLASRMDARARRVEERLSAAKADKRYEGGLWMDASPARRSCILSLPKGAIPCGGDLLAFPALHVGPRDHVGISGPNGAGKSTLARHLLTRLPEGLEALVIPQEIAPNEADSFLRRLKELPKSQMGAVLSVVARLNSDPDRALAGAAASPGELRKLMIAAGILRNPALVIMDEPTNHLDIHSVEALEDALAAYPAALVLISHDRPFLEAATSIRWRVENGTVRVE